MHRPRSIWPLFATIFFASVTVVEADGLDRRWIELLRDAQDTNRAALRQGHAGMELRYKPSGKPEGILIIADILWSENDYILKIRTKDPYMMVLGRKDPEGPIEAQPWNLFNKSKSGYAAYNPQANYARIFPPDPHAGGQLLQFHPWVVWLKCCYPGIIEGPPWKDLIGVKPPALQDSLLEFDRVAGERFTQVRRDPDGGISRIVFSLEAGGNVESFSYENPRVRSVARAGRFQWRKQENAYVLASCRVTLSKPGRDTEIDEEFDLRLTHVDLTPVPASRVSLNAFYERLPKNVKVYNELEKRTFLLHPSNDIMDVKINLFEKMLKSGNFLNKSK